jgi:hypothetical protein
MNSQSTDRPRILVGVCQFGRIRSFGVVMERQLTAPNLDIRRSFEPKPYLPAFDLEYRHHNPITDHDSFANLAAQYQHGVPPSWTQGQCRCHLNEPIPSYDRNPVNAGYAPNNCNIFQQTECR